MAGQHAFLKERVDEGLELPRIRTLLRRRGVEVPDALIVTARAPSPSQIGEHRAYALYDIEYLKGQVPRSWIATVHPSPTSTPPPSATGETHVSGTSAAGKSDPRQ